MAKKKKHRRVAPLPSPDKGTAAYILTHLCMGINPELFPELVHDTLNEAMKSGTPLTPEKAFMIGQALAGALELPKGQETFH